MSQPGQQLNQQIPVNGQIYFGQDFYIYTATFGSIAPGGNSQQNIQIQSDSDFEWIEATAFGFLHGATPPYIDNILLPINISLVDSGSSRQLFNAPIPLTQFAGNGRQPFILPVSRLFKAYTNIQVVAVSLDPVNTYDFLSLNFIGRKLFVKNAR
jgi:hypothetical protein